MDAPIVRTDDPLDGRGPWRRVVLVGFMTSGKTEVGRALARRLGWAHVDLDHEIERTAGMRIEQIFASRGEASFRAMEVELTPLVLAREDVVVSPGGGWIANPGLFEALPPDTLTVWLKVSPSEVLRRLGRSRSQRDRPLLRGGDRASRVRELLTQREPLYQRAMLVVDTDSVAVRDIVDRIVTALRGGELNSNQTRS